MVLALKLLIGGLAGGALIATPVIASQFMNPSSSKDVTANSTSPKVQYKNSKGVKIECHGNRTFGLRVDGETVLWSAIRGSAESANSHQHQNRGIIFEEDKSSCELE